MKRPHFVVCLDSSQYPSSLELHKIYAVMPDEDGEARGFIRIVDANGEDYLYPVSLFEPIEPSGRLKDLLLRQAK